MRRRPGPTGDEKQTTPRIPMLALRQAIAVAEHLNFSHAANALGVSQSSVSARIRALEQDLGILLFERNTRGVRLTEAGRHFVDRVSESIDQLDHAVKTAGMAAHGECGRLRIAIHALISHSFLSQLIGKYREDHPCIDIEIVEETAREAFVQLREDRIDAAFVAGTPKLPDFHSRKIWTEPLVAALPSSHILGERTSLTWNELAHETFLVRHGGSGPQVCEHIVLRLAGHWPAPSILRFEVGLSTLLSLIEQGFGVTVLGAAASMSPAPGVVFASIADEPEPVSFSAVWSPFNRSAALRNLLSLAGKMKPAP